MEVLQSKRNDLVCPFSRYTFKTFGIKRSELSLTVSCLTTTTTTKKIKVEFCSLQKQHLPTIYSNHNIKHHHHQLNSLRLKGVSLVISEFSCSEEISSFPATINSVDSNERTFFHQKTNQMNFFFFFPQSRFPSRTHNDRHDAFVIKPQCLGQHAQTLAEQAT